MSPTAVPSTAAPSLQPTYYPSTSPSTVFIITTIAGTGTASYSGDSGAATAAELFLPIGVRVDATGERLDY